jgi:hypothetical protein
MPWIRAHLTYANVVATLALVLAMSGGALAATHYLINSTKQINPKVLRQLRGHTGRAGLQGPPGVGSQGVEGPPGQRGTRGEPGPQGLSALASLPAGQSESGTFGVRSDRAHIKDTIADTIAYPVPLGESAASTHIVFTQAKVAAEHCSGPGSADKGYLCIYETADHGVGPAHVFGFEASEEADVTGRHGFTLQWEATEEGAYAFGTYTVTAG